MKTSANPDAPSSSPCKSRAISPSLRAARSAKPNCSPSNKRIGLMSESSRRKNAPDLPRRISLKMEVKQVKQTPNTLALTKRHQLRQNQKLQKLLTEKQL